MAELTLFQLITSTEKASVLLAGVPDVSISDLKVSDLSKLYTCIKADNCEPVPAVEVLMLRCLNHRQNNLINQKLVQQSKP
jgi:hypothetical protein